MKLTFIPRTLQNPYFNSVIEGFKTACKAVDFDFTTVGPATAAPTSQVPFVTAQIKQGVDVIAIVPNSPTALNPVLDQARSSGALVLAINADMPGSESHRDAAILPVDLSKVGASQVELMGSLIHYEGDIAILSTTTTSPDQNQWIAGMKVALSQDSKYARMKWLATAHGNDDAQQSATETQALLAKHPTLKGIIAPTAVGLPAAAQVVETAGVAQRIKVTGLGTPNVMRRWVHNGTVSSFQLWIPYNLGLVATYFAAGVKQGKIKNKAGKTFTVPGLEKMTVREHNVIWSQPQLTTFDRANIDRYNF